MPYFDIKKELNHPDGKKYICIGTEEYIWEELEIIYIKKWSGTFLVVHLWKWRGRVFGRHCTQLCTLIIKTHINVSLVLSKRLPHILFSLMNMKLMPVGATETENARAEVSWTHLRWQVLGQIVQVAQGLC